MQSSEYSQLKQGTYLIWLNYAKKIGLVLDNQIIFCVYCEKRDIKW